MIKYCPICNSSQITEGPEGTSCQKCGWTNNPDYLKKMTGEEE